jgi:hypothetical protein
MNLITANTDTLDALADASDALLAAAAVMLDSPHGSIHTPEGNALDRADRRRLITLRRNMISI